MTDLAQRITGLDTTVPSSTTTARRTPAERPAEWGPPPGTNHAPRYTFVTGGPPIYGFLTTMGQNNEVHARAHQSELILAYCSARGWSRPTIQSDASRETLFRNCPQGGILVVPRLASLFSRPSHISEIVQWMLRKQITIHAVESGGDIAPQLNTLRACGEAFAGLETEIERLNAALVQQEQDHAVMFDDFARDLAQKFAAKAFDLRHVMEVTKVESAQRAQRGAANRELANQIMAAPAAP